MGNQMIISHDNTLAQVSSEDKDLIKLVKDRLTYTDPKAKHTQAYKNHHWDGKRSLFSEKYQTFPAGLLYYVTRKLNREKIPFELIDKRPLGEPSKNRMVKSIYELRPHQQAAVDIFLDEERNRGIIKLPTRSGKTVIAGYLISYLNIPSLFVVPDKRLLNQTYDEFRDIYGLKCGKLGDGNFSIKHHNIAIINSVARYLKSPNSKENKQRFHDRARQIRQMCQLTNFVIFDECHLSSGDYQLVSMSLTHAGWRLGLSATPLLGGKKQKLFTMAMTGDLLYEQEIETLAERGDVVKPTVFFVRCDHSPSNMVQYWEDAYREGIIENEKRNKMIGYISMSKAKSNQVLILVESIEQGNFLNNLIKDKGYKSDFVYGKHDGDKRQAAIHDIQSGRLDVLIASRIFNQGVDIPLLDVVIIAGGYKSAILTYQRYGRGMTKTKTKKRTEVYDFYDAGSYFLEKHSNERMDLVKKEKAFDLQIITIGDLK
jgi:superfamily II DNA or RNA helicase